MRRLLPLPGDIALAELAEQMVIKKQPHQGWHLRTNMISTIDGAIRGASGTSVDFSNADDRAMLGMLRAVSDAVVVGSRNALAQPYTPLEPRPSWAEFRRQNGLAPAPRLVVVTNTGLPVDAPCFAAPHTPTVVITSEACPPETRAGMGAVAEVIVAGESTVDLQLALGELSSLGLWRVLCEGGPGLLSAFSSAQLLDEACITTAAIWSGAADTAMTSGAPGVSQPPAHMYLSHLLIDDDDYLYARWIREPR